LEVLCSKPQTRRLSHYDWTKDGGQVNGVAIGNACAMGGDWIRPLLSLLISNLIPLFYSAKKRNFLSMTKSVLKFLLPPKA
jgi:hypothetical protein